MVLCKNFLLAHDFHGVYVICTLPHHLEDLLQTKSLIHTANAIAP